jgi:hypothetical protein
MSQNRTQWNLDFRFHLETLFLDCSILLYIIDNDNKLAPHLFEQHLERSGMDVSITSSNQQACKLSQKSTISKNDNDGMLFGFVPAVPAVYFSEPCQLTCLQPFFRMI